MNTPIQEIEVTNLRGFYRKARLSLNREKTVLVGRNNSGKTSILLILRWLLEDAGKAVLNGERALDGKESDLLLPARSTRHRARRVLLRVKVGDPDKQKKYKCDDDNLARLIFDYRISSPSNTGALRLLPPGRDRPAQDWTFETDPEALDLLEHLRDQVRLIFIPSFRDVGSERFDDTIREAYMARLEERALHPNKRGAPREKRKINEMLDSLEDIVEDLVQPHQVNFIV
jgi:energy-coupling factor transporter ATP-binding protein EcfA2